MTYMTSLFSRSMQPGRPVSQNQAKSAGNNARFINFDIPAKGEEGAVDGISFRPDWLDRLQALGQGLDQSTKPQVQAGGPGASTTIKPPKPNNEFSDWGLPDNVINKLERPNRYSQGYVHPDAWSRNPDLGNPNGIFSNRPTANGSPPPATPGNGWTSSIPGALPPPSPQAGKFSGYKATGYDPTSVRVSQNATASGRLNQLMDEDSRYMQLARQKALEMVNERGMVNSSMAVGAAQNAAIEAALPLAQQDAGTYAQREMATMDSQNQAREFGATAQNQAGQFNSQMDADMQKFNASESNRMGQEQWGTLTNQRHDQLMQSLTNDQQVQMENINKQWNRLLQSDESMANMWGTYYNTLNSIMINTNLKPDQQMKAADDLLEQFNNFTNYYDSLQKISSVGIGFN